MVRLKLLTTQPTESFRHTLEMIKIVKWVFQMGRNQTMTAPRLSGVMLR